MDLNIDAEVEEFRLEVRDFLAANTASFPTESYDTAEGFEQHRRWDKVLFDAGLSVISWPRKYGGRDATLLQWVVFEEEYFRAGAPGRASANGTSMLAPTLFEHDAAAALAFGAFVLAWQGRCTRAVAAAGLLAGLAVFFEYAAALAVLVVGAYVARRGARRLGVFVLGALPGAAALAAYNWAAFGSPFHLSYRYVANPFAERQHHGFFGIGLPTLGGLRDVLAGNRGLLVFSPVTLAAAAGLWLMWRHGHRAEALVAGGLTGAFILINAGYFLPYGGSSPGPRFLALALPFLALGLPFAFHRFPRGTLGLALVSAGLTTAGAVTWGVRPFDDTAWIPGRDQLAKTVWAWLGVNRIVGAGILLSCALATVGLGGAVALRSRGRVIAA